MPFQIPLNHKFGCICLANAAVDRELREPLDLGGGSWAIFGPPMDLAPHWQTWLGSVKAENFARARITFLAHRASERPEIADDENESLIKDAYTLFSALSICEIFHYDDGMTLGGANNNGQIDIRTVSEIETHIRPNNVRPSRIVSATIRRASSVASGIRLIHSERFQRLRSGYRAWHKGIREYYGQDRLHQFIRALESVVKPEIGRTERQFVHRCQIFAGASEQARALFSELYKMRSQTEHMNGLESVLAIYPAASREEIALRRAYQAQILASHVFEQILTRPELLAIFDSDENIDEFWTRRRSNEQQTTWGRAIDLETEASARFLNGIEV